MARARNIKPGFFKNYDLADLGPHCQILFAGLWCLADREGRLEDKPRLIKAEIFPYYEFDVNGGLTQLERCNFVRRYIVNGGRYIEVVNFKKHQSPHNTEKSSTYPPPQADGEKTCSESTSLDNNESLTVGSRKPNDGNSPDSLIHGFTDSLIPDSPKPSKKPAKPVGDGFDLESGFDAFWQAYPLKQAKQDAIKAWKKLKPDKSLLEKLLAAVEKQKTWPSWDRGFTPQASTWLNGKRWMDDPPPMQQQSPPRQPSNRQSVDFSQIDYGHGLTENEDGSFKLN